MMNVFRRDQCTGREGHVLAILVIYRLLQAAIRVSNIAKMRPNTVDLTDLKKGMCGKIGKFQKYLKW